MDPGTSRKRFRPDRPSYAAWQHYESTLDWADASLRRLKTWQFTTIGGWGDHEALAISKEHSLWITPVLHAGSTAGAPWKDMWDAKNLARMEEVASEQIGPLRGDPRVIGYFSDNEIGWWNAALWKITLAQEASSGQRQRLIQLLREIYRDDWSALQQDFESGEVSSWEELEVKGSLAHRPGRGGVRTMRRFLALAADRYYRLMRDLIRKHDPRALYLGDRYQSFYYPEVAFASAPYVDVVSTNLKTSWNDGTFLRCYLDTLHALTGKPIIASEFYSAAAQNRSGNKNASSTFPVVETQADRAAAVGNTLAALARLSYVVGIDWFQYYDEPPFGRHDGEDYNFGLVDIHDEPYQEVTTVFAAFDAQQVRSAGQRPRLDASGGVPPAPANPFANFQFTEALKHWDRERGFVNPTSDFPIGDLYVCWSADAVYLGLFAIDIVEKRYYRDGAAPEDDRAVWSVQIDKQPTVSARIGGGVKPIVNPAGIRVECLSGVDHEVSCVAIMKLPAAYWGKKAMQAGDTIHLRATLWSHGGAYRNEWKAVLTLASDAPRDR
jgi:hypothetical protein